MLFPVHTAAGFPNMQETPGIYYAIAYWLSTVLFIHLLPKRVGRGMKWGILIGAGVFLGFFMTITKSAPQKFFIPLMAVDALILFFMFWSVADVDLKGAMYYTIRSFIMGEFVASFYWQMFYYLVSHHILALRLQDTFLSAIIIYGIFYVAAYLLERRYKESNKELDLSWNTVIGALIISLAVYFFSNISFATQNTPFSARFTGEILLLRTSVDTIGLVVLYMYHILLHQMRAQVEVKTLQNMLAAQYANYRMSRDSVDMINRKYHDLKHQIAILRAEAADGEAVSREDKMKYLDQMEDDIRQYEAQNKTGNNVLDIILTGKSLLCQRHHIELTVVADGHALDFMDTMDLSALFGNALDNAIESVRKIDNYSKRLIHLTIVREKGFVHIDIENTFSGEIHFRNGLPVTTKKDKGYHGFGVKSMRATAEKYGGSLTIDTRDDWFRVHILLPWRDTVKG